MAKTSWKWTGRSFACSPRRLVEPITWPVFMPPPASRAQRDLRPVVAAAVLVDLRRAAELAPDHHRHVLVQPALVQVFDQRGQALIEHRQVMAGVLEGRAVRLAVPVPAAVGQRHARGRPPRPAGGRRGSSRSAAARRRRSRPVRTSRGRTGRAAAASSVSRSSASASWLDVEDARAPAESTRRRLRARRSRRPRGGACRTARISALRSPS